MVESPQVLSGKSTIRATLCALAQLLMLSLKYHAMAEDQAVRQNRLAILSQLTKKAAKLAQPNQYQINSNGLHSSQSEKQMDPSKSLVSRACLKKNRRLNLLKSGNVKLREEYIEGYHIEGIKIRRGRQTSHQKNYVRYNVNQLVGGCR